MAPTVRKNAFLIPAWWLVLFTYVAFGWYWHSLVNDLDRLPLFQSLPILFWPFVLLVNLLIISLCTVPHSVINPRVLKWFDSSLFSFIFVIFVSVISVLILTNINALTTLLVLGTVIMIARLDLQVRAYSTAQSWILLLLAAALGSGIGIIAHQWQNSDLRTMERSQQPYQSVLYTAQSEPQAETSCVLSQSQLT